MKPDQLLQRRPILSRADALFAQLDGQKVGVGHGSWIIEISGIHLGDDEAWIQVAPSTDATGGVVLHLLGHATAGQALEALTAWTDRPHEAQFGEQLIQIG